MPDKALNLANLFTWANLKSKPVYDVKSYGATGDGTTNDTAAFTAAYNAAVAAGGGIIFVPPGTYRAKATVDTKVSLQGAGIDISTIKLPDGANDHVVQVPNFAALIAGNSTTSPNNFSIRDITIDGNKANQSAGDYYGIAVYARVFILDCFKVQNTAGSNLFTQWSTSGPDPGGGLGTWISNGWLHYADRHSWVCKGVHDLQAANLEIIKNSGNTYNCIEIPQDGYANGAMFNAIHIYGGQYQYGVRNASSGLVFDNCQFEGAIVAQMKIDASQNRVTGTKFFSGGVYGSTTKGVVFANNINNIQLDSCRVENCGGGVIDLGTGGGDHSIDIHAQFYGGATVPSPAIIGSSTGNSRIDVMVINNSGIATSDSRLWTPGDFNAPNVLNYSQSGSTSRSIVETSLRELITGNNGLTSGQVYFSYFTPDYTISISNLTSVSRGTAAGATPTLCKMGLYAVDSSSNLTCIARTANDTALWASGNTAYTRAIVDDGQGGSISSVTLTRGQRYAFAVIIITGAALPQLAAAPMGNGAVTFLPPILATVSGTGQTDLTASYTAASVSGTGAKFYGRMS